MEAKSPASSEGRAVRWSSRKKNRVIAITLVIVAALSMYSLYEFYLEDEHLFGFDPYVSYNYAVAIASNSSDQYRVLCPFPSDAEGNISIVSLQYLRGSWGVEARQVTDQYGEALEVIGSGVVIVTLNIKSELPGPWENFTQYSYLSMTNLEGAIHHANVYSNVSDVMFGILFSHSYVYGNLGADFVHYQCDGNLSSGWNSVVTSVDRAVS
ncbi:MAG: hypothetical protein IH630_06400 [Thermoplasmata archaeon]|nr:hypothetical protein [Thermoplasmata archaeon]